MGLVLRVGMIITCPIIADRFAFVCGLLHPQQPFDIPVFVPMGLVGLVIASVVSCRTAYEPRMGCSDDVAGRFCPGTGRRIGMVRR
jgi:hypothetical protein